MNVPQETQIMNDSNEMPKSKSGPNTDWKESVAKYQHPSAIRASWQIVSTLVPYAALWWLMYISLAVSWWLAIPLAMLAGAFLIRVFIIFHDCGHGSFFKSRTATFATRSCTPSRDAINRPFR